MPARETIVRSVRYTGTGAAPALRAVAAVLVMAAGWCGGDNVTGAATSQSAASSITAPAPPPAPGGALPVRPAGGGACIIGLNCGCIRYITCPGSRPRPPATNNQQHAAPAPQDPELARGPPRGRSPSGVVGFSMIWRGAPVGWMPSARRHSPTTKRRASMPQGGGPTRRCRTRYAVTPNSRRSGSPISTIRPTIRAWP